VKSLVVDLARVDEGYRPEKPRQQVGLFLSVAVLVFTTNCSPKYYDDDLCDRLAALADETGELLLKWQERINATPGSLLHGVSTELNAPFKDVVDVIRTSANTIEDLITRDDRIRPLTAASRSLSRLPKDGPQADIAPFRRFIADELGQRCPARRGPSVESLEAP